MSGFLAAFVSLVFHAWYSPLVIVALVAWIATLAAASGTTENDADFDTWERGVTRN